VVGGQRRLAAQARAICAQCEVQGECLEFALRHPEETEFGVWGGTTPGQRRRLRGLKR
jgi:WhiB family transcriptional regulator, redox-sensing transcriptional regulator